MFDISFNLTMAISMLAGAIFMLANTSKVLRAVCFNVRSETEYNLLQASPHMTILANLAVCLSIWLQSYGEKMKQPRAE